MSSACPGCEYVGSDSNLKRHWENSPTCGQYYEDLLLDPPLDRARSSSLDPPSEDDVMDIDEDASSDADQRHLDLGPQADATEDSEDAALASGVRWVSPYPGDGPTMLRREKSRFERRRDDQRARGENPFSPFANEKDWELGKWMAQNLSKRQINELLKTAHVSFCFRRGRTQDADSAQMRDAGVGFHNAYSLHQLVDALPTGAPWKYELITISGDADADGETPKEVVELWLRDTLEVTKDLFDNPAFRNVFALEPELVFADGDSKNRIVDEAWTADWWHVLQVSLGGGLGVWLLSVMRQRTLDEKNGPGGVAAKLMVSSDKTTLTMFRGNKQAWPVYLTIGNIMKSHRRKASSHATVLIGYLPVADLKFIKDEDKRRMAHYDLFHSCMRKVFAPLIQAGLRGVEMVCPDGGVRRVFPIVGAYMADYPEQCLVCCTKSTRCPICTVPAKDMGEGKRHPYRDKEETLTAMLLARGSMAPDYYYADGIRPTFDPFWAELPHCNIFRCVTADVLHEVHKFWWDHVRKWVENAFGARELDARYMALAPFAGLQHFAGGISKMQKTTMKEHKQMEKGFLPLVASASNRALVRATRGMMEFVYLVQLHAQTPAVSVHGKDGVRAALQLFHDNKRVFVDIGARQKPSFAIPKLEKLSHYAASIVDHGSADGTNTEHTEQLHRPYCHLPFKAGNGQDYLEQMTVRMRRLEALERHAAYLDWSLNDPPSPDDAIDDDDDDDDDVPTRRGSRSAAETTTEKDEPEDEVDVAYDVSSRFFLARECPFPQVAAEDIISRHGASSFLPALKDYLRSHVRGCKITPGGRDRFDVYAQVRVRPPANPYMPNQTKLERIRTTPSRAAGARKREKPGCFDPALVRVPYEGQRERRIERKSAIGVETSDH
jgi:hypothetical protein